MDFKLRYFKFLIDLIILCSLFPKISPVLSFTYPQSTTLNNKNILVVEKEGIHICDPSFTSKIRTVYSFPDEDKITTSSSLSKTFIKKSSYAILILSNYKLYFIDYNNGALLKSTSKVIAEEEPEYINLAYSYDYVHTLFYFTVSYISESNNLIVKFYEYVKSSNTVYYYNSFSGSSVNRESKTFTFQKKGLSCDSIVDSRSNTYYGGYDYGFYSYFVCFIIANDETDDYLIPLSFEEGESGISFYDNYYTMDKIKVNNNIQIKSDTDCDMTTDYVCYVIEENIGTCRAFQLDKYYKTGSFSSNIKTFTKNCRSDLYGMKVTYIFENDDVLFTCSDLDGSIQVKMLNQNQGHYFKYQNCNNIYGYSIIYLADSENYYVTSDVTCPEGKIPYVILIEPSDYIPEVVAIDTTNKESLIESSSISSTMAKEKIIETTYQEKIDIQTTNKLTEKITEKIPEEIQQSTIAREKNINYH
jgi:predicted kinase